MARLRDDNRNAKRGRTKKVFLSGVVILTASNLIVKMLGLSFKIPMNYTVGDTGMGYYNSAYSVYTFFYMLSTSGLPVAISVMVSELRARGNVRGAKSVYRMALGMFLLIGLAVTLLMILGSGWLANLIRSPHAALSIAVSGPAILFTCLAGAWRGYFQGCGNMTPIAVSQMIEAAGKVFIGIFAAMIAIGRGAPIYVVAAFAVFGLTAGSLLGAVYLLIARIFRGDRDLLPEDLVIRNEALDRGDVLRRFLKISLPVTVSASVMSISGMIDTAMIQRTLAASGLSEEAAATLFGNYTSLAVPMFNLPPVLVYPIAFAIVPAIASSLALGNRQEAAAKIEMAIRYAVIIGVPCALGMSVLAEPILRLFYQDASARMAAPLLTLLAPSSFFVCLLAVTNSILQACGKERYPVISMLCGATVKGIAGGVLIRQIGIAGAPISTLLCYLTVTLLNTAFTARFTGIRPAFGTLLIRPLLCGILCAVSAGGSYRVLAQMCGDSPACLGAIGIAAAVYLVTLILTGAVSRTELSGLLRRSQTRAMPR